MDVIFYLFTLADGSLFGGISIEIWPGLSFASSIRFLRKGILHSCVSTRPRLTTHTPGSPREGPSVFPIHAWPPRGRGNKGIKTRSLLPSHPHPISRSTVSSNVSLLTPFRNVFSPDRPPLFPLPILAPSDSSKLGTVNYSGPITVPPLAPFAAGMLQRKPLATLDPQSAHSRLTEDMSNSPSSSRLPPDPKDTAANRYARQIVSRGSIGDEGLLIQSVSSSRKNSLSQ